MSLLWIEAVRPQAPAVEQVPIRDLGNHSYWRAWGSPEHPAMAAVMQRIREGGGYDPQRHGMLHVTLGPDEERDEPRLSLPREHHFPEFGENSGHALAFALSNLGHRQVPAMVTRLSPPKPAVEPTKRRVFYHGTTTNEDLHEVLPAAQHGTGVIHQHQTDPSYAYATPSAEDAWYWAEQAHHMNGERPRVLKVRRRGPVEPDVKYDVAGNSRGIRDQDVRSRHGFDVIGEEPMPKHMRDWYERED